MLPEQVVDEDESRHGLHHGNGTREHTGVVAPARGETGVFARDGHGILRSRDGGGGFESDAEDDGLTIADAALNAAGEIRGGADLAVDDAEGVVVLGAAELAAREAGADFKALRGREAEHGLGEIGVEFVKDRLAEPARAAAHDALEHSPTESPSLRTSLIRSIMAAAVAASGQRTEFASMASEVTASGSMATLMS